jgi:hypothetical protein
MLRWRIQSCGEIERFGRLVKLATRRRGQVCRPGRPVLSSTVLASGRSQGSHLGSSVGSNNDTTGLFAALSGTGEARGSSGSFSALRRIGADPDAKKWEIQGSPGFLGAQVAGAVPRAHKGRQTATLWRMPLILLVYLGPEKAQDPKAESSTGRRIKGSRAPSGRMLDFRGKITLYCVRVGQHARRRN